MASSRGVGVLLFGLFLSLPLSVRGSAPERAWSGTALVGDVPYASSLHVVESQAGVRPSGIDRCLALVVESPAAKDRALIVITGSRDLSAARSFGGNIELGDLDLHRILRAGFDLIIVEYRGSKTPGADNTFEPPLPGYESLIPGFSRDDACEYGYGDGYDAVAVARAVTGGDLLGRRPEKTYVIGGSHGGYLALRIARDVPGIDTIIAGHPPVDMHASYSAIQDPPDIPPPFFALKPPYFVLNTPKFAATYRDGDKPTAQERYRVFMAAMKFKPVEEAEASLLDRPPRCKRLLVFSNVDDLLVNVYNQRAYHQKWVDEFERFYYFEFSSRETADLFPRAVESQNKSGVLSTHNEDIIDSPLEKAVWQLLDMEPGQPAFDPRHSSPQRTNFSVRLVAADSQPHDFTGWTLGYMENPWRPGHARNHAAGSDGTAELEDVLIGYARVELRNPDGAVAARPWLYAERENPRPIDVLVDVGKEAFAFETVSIDEEFPRGYYVDIADINGDGRPDIVALREGAKGLVAWYENPTWTAHRITPESITRPIHFLLQDADYDGDLDMVLAHGFDTGDTVEKGATSLLVQGEDPSAPWTPHFLDSEPTAHRLAWLDVNGDGRDEVIVVPLLGRGAKGPNDLEAPVRLKYVKMPWGPESRTRPTGVLCDNLHLAHGICAPRRFQIGEANPLHTLIASSYEGITWFLCRNSAAVDRRLLHRGHTQREDRKGSSDVAEGALAGSPGIPYLASVEPWHGNEVVVYTQLDSNAGSATTINLQRSVIDTELELGHGLLCADLNKDGADEILVGDRNGKKCYHIYSPGVPFKGDWTHFVLDDGEMAGAGCAVADIDGDMDMDIVAAGSSTGNLRLYLNKMIE